MPRFTLIKYFVVLSLFVVLGPLPVFADSCCGPVTHKAQKMESLLSSFEVESHWLNGIHVDWQTGISDRPSNYQGPDRHSHCSVFAKVVARKLGVELLGPPESAQTFLATAQAKWLLSSDGLKAGWLRLSDMKEAQIRANRGEIVLAVFPSELITKSGHIAVLRPMDKENIALELEGPQIIQAGKTNYNSTSVKIGFNNHPGAFPAKILYFSHQVTLAD